MNAGGFMKRVVALVLSLVSGMCLAAGFVAGKDYEVLSDAPKIQPGKPVLVAEFFSYGCPWCYQLNKPLHEFINKQGKQVEFQQVPVVFQPGWNVYAKAYYAAKRLNKLDTLGPAIFKAVQEDKKKLDNDKAMVDFFVEQGVDKETAESAFFRSPTIDSDVNQGNLAMAKYRIRGVPAVVVNGRYKVDLSMAGKVDRFFAILDFLIHQVDSKPSGNNP
jgi:thiol:disulfide interchange protein DsbA